MVSVNKARSGPRRPKQGLTPSRCTLQCRNRRVRSRGGCVHRPKRQRRSQRQSDGAPDHDQRVQDRERQSSHGCDPLLPVRQTGQEGQGKCSYNGMRYPGSDQPLQRPLSFSLSLSLFVVSVCVAVCCTRCIVQGESVDISRIKQWKSNEWKFRVNKFIYLS